MRNGANSRRIARLVVVAALALSCALPAGARPRPLSCDSLPLTAVAQGAPWAQAPAASRPTVRYEISVSLDPASHVLRGRERLHWRNPTRSPLCTLYLHLDLNAFEHSATSLMRARDMHGTQRRPAAGEWGYSRITRIEQGGRSAVWLPVQVPGGLADDRSVVRVDLPEPVAPGATTTLDIAFASRLPGAWAGLGHHGDLHVAARWFPQLALLVLPSDRGATPRWSAPPYTGQPVSRRNRATFDVRIDLPADYVLAAGTAPVVAPVMRNDRRIHRLRLDDATDFAWIAARRLVPLQYTYTPPGGAPVRLRVLHRRSDARAAAAALGAMADALANFGASLHPYPHPALTAVVVPAANGPTLGGYASPGLFTVSNLRSDSLVHDGRAEQQAIAGVGAAYFAGLLPGDDEATRTREQSLVDYWTARVLRERGQTVAAPSDWPARLGFARSLDSFAATRMRARLQRPPGGLRATVDRGTLALHDLEARIGVPAMDRAFRAFHARRVDDGDARDMPDREPDPLERLLLEGPTMSAVVDDRIGALRSEEVLPQPGYVLHRSQRIELTGELLERAVARRRAAWRRGTAGRTPGPFPYRTMVEVQRLGAAVPQLLEVRFADGSVRRVRWNDAQPVQRFEWITASRAVSAQLDPQRQILLDRNKLDDGRTLALDTAPARRWAGDLAALVQSFSTVVVGL